MMFRIFFTFTRSVKLSRAIYRANPMKIQKPVHHTQTPAPLQKIQKTTKDYPKPSSNSRHRSIPYVIFPLLLLHNQIRFLPSHNSLQIGKAVTPLYLQ